jgi:hypothetical protein
MTAPPTTLEAPEPLAGQSLGAARCCAIRSETPEEYRTRTQHQWKKHQNAEDNMMRWMWPRNGKQRRRQRKWMREYERTLHAIPKPNIPENTY